VRIPAAGKGQGSPATVVGRGLAGPNRGRNSDSGKGKRVNIPVPRGYASRQREARPPTPRGRRTGGPHAGATRLTARRPGRAVMARTGRRGEWGAYGPFRRSPGPMKRGPGRIPRARTENRHRCPWVRSPRRLGVNPGQGTRQIGPVTSGEGVPAVLGPTPGAAGRSA